MKSKNEQVADALALRTDEINVWRSQNIGYATSLYINEHLTSELYCSICDGIHRNYDAMIDKNIALAEQIRNS